MKFPSSNWQVDKGFLVDGIPDNASCAVCGSRHDLGCNPDWGLPQRAVCQRHSNCQGHVVQMIVRFRECREKLGLADWKMLLLNSWDRDALVPHMSDEVLIQNTENALKNVRPIHLHGPASTYDESLQLYAKELADRLKNQNKLNFTMGEAVKALRDERDKFRETGVYLRNLLRTFHAIWSRSAEDQEERGALRKLFKVIQPGAEETRLLDATEPQDELEGARTGKASSQSGEGVKRPGSLQERVAAWMRACFGDGPYDEKDRGHRFLEESLELVQSLRVSAEEAHQLVHYVFGRDPGNVEQEAGGVAVTLAALGNAAAFDVSECGEAELARVWERIPEIRKKEAAKSKFSPLPGLLAPCDACNGTGRDLADSLLACPACGRKKTR